MSVARLRALTPTMIIAPILTSSEVEMSVARLRALTLSIGISVKMILDRRNECGPFEGIDTYPLPRRSRGRSPGRNECGPFEGIDTQVY